MDVHDHGNSSMKPVERDIQHEEQDIRICRYVQKSDDVYSDYHFGGLPGPPQDLPPLGLQG